MVILPRLALALLATSALTAADFTGGIQLGPAIPSGDMRKLTDGNSGASLVFFGLWNLNDHHGVRLRLDGVSAKGRPNTIPTPAGETDTGGFYKFTVGTSTFGVDYLYSLEAGRGQGAYLGAGLGNTHATLEVDDIDDHFLQRNSSNSLSYGLYAGYRFNPHWSVELAYRDATFRSTIQQRESRYSVPSASFMAGYTF